MLTNFVRFRFLSLVTLSFYIFFIYTSKLGDFEVRASSILGGGWRGVGFARPLGISLSGVPEYDDKISEIFHKTCYAVVSIFKTYVFKLIQF